MHGNSIPPPRNHVHSGAFRASAVISPVILVTVPSLRMDK